MEEDEIYNNMKEVDANSNVKLSFREFTNFMSVLAGKNKSFADNLMKAIAGKQEDTFQKPVKKKVFDPSELRYISKIFNDHDQDKSGELDVPEIEKTTEEIELEIEKEKMVDKMKEADKNFNGSLSYREFCTFLGLCMDSDMFLGLDKDGNVKVLKHSLVDALKQNPPEKKKKIIWKEIKHS